MFLNWSGQIIIGVLGTTQKKMLFLEAGVPTVSNYERVCLVSYEYFFLEAGAPTVSY